MRESFRLRGGVAVDEPADPIDVRNVQRALARLGHYRPLGQDASADAVDRPLRDASREFQNDFRLRGDGRMAPGGPTESHLRLALHLEDEPAPDGSPAVPHRGLRRTARAGLGTASPTPKFKPIPPLPIGPEGPVVSPQFGDAIHQRESPKKNYREANQFGFLGRYQMGEEALQEAGMLDAQGNWTGKHGIDSENEFLNSPLSEHAQDAAFAEYLDKTITYLNRAGIQKHIGQRIDGLKARFAVTESGLVAAAHRYGQGTVKAYLDHLRQNGWKSDVDQIQDQRTRRAFLAVETRLREFEAVPLR